MFNNELAGDIEILKVNEIAVHEERSILEAPSDSSESSLLREDQNGEMPDACDERSVSDVSSDPIASSPTKEDHNDETPDVGDDKPSISLPQVIYLLIFVFISLIMFLNINL